MSNARRETQKRLQLAEEITGTLEHTAKAVILAGSVAYAPDTAVHAQSDLDILLLAEDLFEVTDMLELRIQTQSALKERYFDGHSIRYYEDDIPVSLHVLRPEALAVIANCFVANLRLFRPDKKEGTYTLQGFRGQQYNYKIKNVDLPEMEGYRTIVPITFIADDEYHIGIHRDKLLSNPKILFDPEGIAETNIAHIWKNTVENLVYESRRTQGQIDLEQRSVVHALSRFEKMNYEVQESITQRQNDTIKQVTASRAQ